MSLHDSDEISQNVHWTSRLLLSAMLTAFCSGVLAQDVNTSKPARGLEQRMPADPQLAELYRYSCKACHAVPASSAPLTGDMEAWKPRMAKGVDVLVQHAIEGFGGMPPLGFCMECSRAELAALIIFMASPPAQ